MKALFALSLILSVPPPPGAYDWVCPYLDNAPTLFGVLGLGPEAAERGILDENSAENITAVVAAQCPQYSPLMDSLSLAVGR